MEIRVCVVAGQMLSLFSEVSLFSEYESDAHTKMHNIYVIVIPFIFCICAGPCKFYHCLLLSKPSVFALRLGCKKFYQV